MADQSPSKQIDAIIAAAADWRGEMLAQLRAIMMDAGADLTEAVKWKMASNPAGAPVWMSGGKNICVANILKNSVRLNFTNTPPLPDPKHLFNARLDSSVVRAIDYHEGDTVDAEALADLTRAAAGL